VKFPKTNIVPFHNPDVTNSSLVTLVIETVPRNCVAELSNVNGNVTISLYTLVLRDEIVMKRMHSKSVDDLDHLSNTLYPSCDATDLKWKIFRSSQLPWQQNSNFDLEIKNGSIDLLSISSDFSYETGTQSIDFFLPKLSHGAVIIFSDTEKNREKNDKWKLVVDLSTRFPSYIEETKNGRIGIIQILDDADEKKLHWLNVCAPTKSLAIDAVKEFHAKPTDGIEAVRSAASFEDTIKNVTHPDADHDALHFTVAEYKKKLDAYHRSTLYFVEKNRELMQSIREKEKVIDTLQELVQNLSSHSNALVNTLSWRVTAPLRWIRARPASLHQQKLRIADWRKKKNKWQLLFRKIYMYFGPLRTLRQLQLRWKTYITSKISTHSYSSDNVASLHALSSRRFVIDAMPCHWLNPQLLELPYIDISVVTFNSERWISKFITSLVTTTYPLRKVHLRFVDHESKDNTLAKLKELLGQESSKFASITIIEQENLGFGKGHDRAIKEGNSLYCLVTNIDIEFLPDTLVKVVCAALSNPTGEVASWELRQIPYEHPKYYDPVTLETNWSSHACILIRRSAYEEVGGYDHRIFMYAEDVELSYRFRSHGYALKYTPNAFVHHFTYEAAGQVKPLQFIGSIVGNVYIRLRYGRNEDRIAGLLQYAARFLWPSPFPGAKALLAKNINNVAINFRHFLNGKGPAQAFFPLRGFDYEMNRDGAFHQVRPWQKANVAPLVTIITRTYAGRSMFLTQAIQSVFNQTYPSIELLVIEDGGETQKLLVNELAEKAPQGYQVRFIANKKLGRSAAGNVGLASSRGKFIAFLDDDDLLFADHVETLVTELEEDPNLSAAYALSYEIHTTINADKSSYIEKLFSTLDLFRQEWNYEVLLDHNFIPIQAILFKRDLYEQRGGFDPALDQLEDWNLWLRYGYGNRFAYIAKTTSLFRSPADFNIRSSRHAMLHIAYNEAKSRALASIESQGGK
jgi:GT2 family glycosyltransferase